MNNNNPIYNPIDAYYIKRDVMRALARMSPMEPKFHKGKYGSRYDNYTCANCGSILSSITWHFCPNCGQCITYATMGRRMTQDEQNKYHQQNIFDLFKNLEKGTDNACKQMER